MQSSTHKDFDPALARCPWSDPHWRGPIGGPPRDETELGPTRGDESIQYPPAASPAAAAAS